MKKKPHETEAALVIRSNNAERIANEIAALDTLGANRLESPETQRIHDIYFDTREQALQKQKLALRIRALNGETLITLKGPSRRQAGGAQERLEIEAPWSRQALARVVRELRDRKIAVAMPRQSFAQDDAIATLTRLGFRIVQDRMTRRRARQVVARAAPQATLAELAVDAVTFRFGKQRVRLHEIEIEAKTPRARLGDLARRLETMFKPALRPWHSKLATGKAIQTLLAKAR